MKFKKSGLDPATLIRLYQELVRPRIIEEKMLSLLRQGRIAKWFSGIGQEAIAVGAGMAMQSDEFILPMHRNLGVFTTRGFPLDRLFAQLQGKAEGYTKGRDRSFHFGNLEHHLVGMISHLGPQLALADGIALACKLKKEKKATLVFTGEGATSEGDFHEALNVAAVWDLPVLFIIENNGYGLSTPVSEQYRCKQLSDRALGYGMEGLTIDGNNILEVYQTIFSKAEEIRSKPRPVLIECMTFRMRGHEEASGTKYVPQELFTQWAVRDPVKNFEAWILEQKLMKPEEVDSFKKDFKAQVEKALEVALAFPDAQSSPEVELGDVYAPAVAALDPEPEVPSPEIRFIDAITQGLDQAMDKHHDLVLMGQDIAEYGGAFKVTDNFVQRYGKERVRNTPICESAIIGAGMGLHIKGMKAVVEMQFADFVSCGFNQIVNNLAKTHYRWGLPTGVTVRMPTGGGVAAGPFHSQSNEAWFFHTPGLKIYYPAFAHDAKGLLLRAIEEANPVMFFEHKFLYRSLKGPVPESYFIAEEGKGSLIREGEQVSIITYGLGVHWAMAYLDAHPEVSADLIDMRTLIPWDKEIIQTSVQKTGKALVLHEDTLTGGIGAEWASWIGEHCFEHLDAPVKRVASLDTPIPMAAKMEQVFLGNARLQSSLVELLSY